MFKFELQPVLSLKEKFEDSKKRELGLANTKHEKLVNEKAKLMLMHDEVYDEIRNQYDSHINVSHLRQFNQYAKHLNKKMAQKEIEIVKAQKIVDQKRDELIEAVKQRKILDKLKEIRFEQFREEELKAENQIVDEIVSYKYGATKRSEE